MAGDIGIGRIIEGEARTGIEYRDIPGFPGYRIGSDGSVWSAWKWTVKPKKHLYISDRFRELKQLPTRRGRHRVALYRDGRCKYLFVYRLVLTAFVGPCPDGMEACHKDGNPTNNSLTNLRWGTHSSNEADKRTHGTTVKGESHPAAKLSLSDVAQIRLRAAGRSQRVLAKEFGVNQRTVARILNGQSWRT